MKPVDELEALDKQALEQQYIASYHYTPAQRIIAGIFVLTIVGGLLLGGIYLCLGIIYALAR